jgi:hypothetical protein
MKETLKKEYRNLEMRTLSLLRDKVENSKMNSTTIDSKAIKVDINNYRELAVSQDRLIFIDNRGQHYSVFNVSLEELIDLID